MRKGWTRGPIGEHLQLELDQVDVEPGEEYPIVGVLNRGRGLLRRDAVTSETTSYRRLSRIAPNRLIYSKLKAFEGAITVTPDSMLEAFASLEFPTFACKEGLIPSYARLLTQHPQLWDNLALLSKGMGGRRERLNPNDFLRIMVSLPPICEQIRISDLMETIDETISAVVACTRNLSAILSATRDRLPLAEFVALKEVLTSIESGTSVHYVPGADEGEERYVLTLAAVRPARFYGDERKNVGCAELPSRAAVREGDLLITRSNTPERVGYVCVARDVALRTYMPDLIWRLNFDPELVSAEYLENVLSSTQLRQVITSTASGTSDSMRKINKRGLGVMRIPLPEPEAQEEYLCLIRPVAASLQQYQLVTTALRHLRSQTLNALLSGKHEIPLSYDELLGA